MAIWHDGFSYWGINIYTKITGNGRCGGGAGWVEEVGLDGVGVGGMGGRVGVGGVGGVDGVVGLTGALWVRWGLCGCGGWVGGRGWCWVVRRDGRVGTMWLVGVTDVTGEGWV